MSAPLAFSEQASQQFSAALVETASTPSAYHPNISPNKTELITEVSDNTSTTTQPPDNSFGLGAFQICIILIGSVGLCGNALVLFILKTNDGSKKSVNVLIMNQMTLDMVSCVFLIIGHSLQLVNAPFEGAWGFVNCCLFYVDTGASMGQMGSIGSLVVITFERYMKIVHSIVHRKYFRKWMVTVTIMMVWINGILTQLPVFWTSRVVDGQCLAFLYFEPPQLQMAYGLSGVVWEYFLPLILFIYFYWKIFVVIRRSTQQFSATNKRTDGSKQNSANRSQRNIIRTLVMVTVAFAICWAPTQIYYCVYLSTTFLGLYFYSATLMIAFLNVCINPFIYSSSHQVVRRQLEKWFCGGITIGSNMVGATSGTETAKLGDVNSSFETNDVKMSNVRM